MKKPLIDQVIGQEHAVSVVRLAARQRRFVLLIGEPGTGKSLLGRSMAELLPEASSYCVVSESNPNDPACPRIRVRAPSDLAAERARDGEAARREAFSHSYLLALAAVGIILVCAYLIIRQDMPLIAIPGFLALLWLWKQRPRTQNQALTAAAKILVSYPEGAAPFIDATASSEGALFGDVRHDPYQSGGAESPPHRLIEPGAVHRAHGGVLYIDEIGNLAPDAQKLLLTAIQDRALPITGRQSGSSGTMIRSEPVPCDFVLVAAGNWDCLPRIIPPLRSRILGYGFEVLTESTMVDSEAAQQDLRRFIQQEIEKDGRIPQFTDDAIAEVIEEARARAEQPGRLTTRLRELGGLVRIAGDWAVQDHAERVDARHVRKAKTYAAPIEMQQRIRQEKDLALNGLRPELRQPLFHTSSVPASVERSSYRKADRSYKDNSVVLSRDPFHPDA